MEGTMVGLLMVQFWLLGIFFTLRGIADEVTKIRRRICTDTTEEKR